MEGYQHGNIGVFVPNFKGSNGSKGVRVFFWIFMLLTAKFLFIEDLSFLSKRKQRQSSSDESDYNSFSLYHFR